MRQMTQDEKRESQELLDQQVEENLSKIRHKIVVISGKGGRGISEDRREM